MKTRCLLSFVFLLNLAHAQVSDTALFFNSGVLGFTQRGPGADTLILERIGLPDTVGLNDPDSVRVYAVKMERLQTFLWTERFSLDDKGQLHDYVYWINCPVGETMRKMLRFKRTGPEVFMTFSYIPWNEGQRSWKINYRYTIARLSENRAELHKVKNR
ncbi:MAG: hypothetical protein IBJ09_09230 [Bacteroidia bacterium]|nr:hypothetical protein [Bacteroidia bacterium]